MSGHRDKATGNLSTSKLYLSQSGRYINQESLNYSNRVTEEMEEASHLKPKILTDDSFEEVEKFRQKSMNTPPERRYLYSSAIKDIGVYKNGGSENKTFRKTWNNFQSGTISTAATDFSADKRLQEENQSLKSLLYNRETELRDALG
jgi:hypothetical protein